MPDGAYPPTTWQVKSYSFNLNLSDTEKSFNKHLFSARATVERAFGVLICQQNHDNYIDNDDVLENVLEQERREGRNKISNHNLCDDAKALREILTQHIRDNT